MLNNTLIEGVSFKAKNISFHLYKTLFTAMLRLGYVVNKYPNKVQRTLNRREKKR